MGDEESRLKAETRADIKTLLTVTTEIKTILGFHSDSLEEMQADIKNLPINCGTGKDHETRIKALEDKPDKKKAAFSQKVGTWVAIIGVPLTIIGLVIGVIFR